MTDLSNLTYRERIALFAKTRKELIRSFSDMLFYIGAHKSQITYDIQSIREATESLRMLYEAVTSCATPGPQGVLTRSDIQPHIKYLWQLTPPKISGVSGRPIHTSILFTE